MIFRVLLLGRGWGCFKLLSLQSADYLFNLLSHSYKLLEDQALLVEIGVELKLWWFVLSHET